MTPTPTPDLQTTDVNRLPRVVALHDGLGIACVGQPDPELVAAAEAFLDDARAGLVCAATIVSMQADGTASWRIAGNTTAPHTYLGMLTRMQLRLARRLELED